MGGDRVSGFPPAILDQIHAGVVLNPGEFGCIRPSTLQCTENAAANISWGGDGCNICTVKEPVAIYAVAQPLEWFCFLRFDEVTIPPYCLALYFINTD